VLATIRAVTSADASVRQPADQALRAWEAESAPGFLTALISIVQAHASIDEASRRCACLTTSRAHKPSTGAIPAASALLGPPRLPHAPAPCQRACARVQRTPPTSRSRTGRETAALPLPSTLQATRLLAAVLAKNTVGSSMSKVVYTREWSRVPEGEQAAVREAVLHMLLNDPSDR
jgi:hypothetical protein